MQFVVAVSLLLKVVENYSLTLYRYTCKQHKLNTLPSRLAVAAAAAAAVRQ